MAFGIDSKPGRAAGSQLGTKLTAGRFFRFGENLRHINLYKLPYLLKTQLAQNSQIHCTKNT